MSHNKEVLAPASSGRRQFLRNVALGAAASPLLSLARGLFARDAEPAASLCYSNKRVLAPTDFSYLGAMRVPESVDMVFSYGGLTGRKVNGQVRLLMLGSRNIGDPIYELADTGTYDPNFAQAPRMSL